MICASLNQFFFIKKNRFSERITPFSIFNWSTFRENLRSDAGSGRTGVRLAAKKRSIHAGDRDTERVRALRAALVEAVQAENFTCFRFVDETSTNLTYCCRYVRTKGVHRAHQATSLHGGSNVTLVPP